ncbi:FG-GAP repeat domain-containing protein [Streptomyces sp. NPDC004290]
MSRARTSRHRLTTAVTVALAVTVGTLTAAPTALATGAAPAAASTTGEQQDVPALAPHAPVIGNGPSGFLSRTYTAAAGTDYQWTRYADGVTTTLLRTGTYAGSVASDVVVRYEGTRYELYDMATGAEPVVIDIAFLGRGVQFERLAGSTLVLKVPRAGGGSDVHLLSKRGDTLVDHTVPGVPGDLVSWYDLSSPDTLLLHHTQEGTTTQRLALVDVATGKVVETRVLTGAERGSDASASATHLAWVEASGTGNAAVRVARRAEEESTRVPLPWASSPTVDLVGDDWVAYAVPGGTAAYSRDPFYALTARSLTDGRTVKLLDTVDRVRADVGGGLLVQGATVEHGEGVYRVAPGPDGTPAATLVASTGRSIARTITDQNVPETVDFSTKGYGGVPLEWRFTGIGYTKATVELTHTASGRRKTLAVEPTPSGRIQASWSGTFDGGTAAYNGDYTWRMTLRPTNGIAPAVERTGTLKVVGKQAPHGFSDSTSPDLLYRDGGRLSLYDARQTFDAVRTGDLTEKVVGSGWDAYDRIVTPGNIGGTEHSDLIARDKAGVLWSYAGTGRSTSPFATRTKVGGGWGGYDQLTAGSDLNGDGRPDLVATDKTGTLWLYRGTGSVTSPFAARTKVGGGWGVYNTVVATGNIGGGTAGDLVARDTAGVLWLYLGKGDGTFADRTRIGSGWNRYSEIVAIGDVTRDGRPDLLGDGLMGGRDDSLALYPGTGDWRTPFSGRTNIATPPELSRQGKTLF